MVCRSGLRRRPGKRNPGEAIPEAHETGELLAAAMVTTLAGRAAEEEIVSTIAIGSGGPAFSDLASATDIAIQMGATLALARSGRCCTGHHG